MFVCVCVCLLALLLTYVCDLFVMYCVMLHGLFAWVSFAGCVLVCVVV